MRRMFGGSTPVSGHLERLHEALIEAQSEAGQGFLVHEGGKPLYANEACFRITGYDPAELETLPSVFDLVVPEERDGLRELMRERLSGRRVAEHYESAITHKSGRRVEVELAVKPLRLGDRTLLVVLLRDVTERRRAEEDKLRMSEEYERIIRALPSVVFRWRRDEDGKMQPTYAEGALAEQFGMTTGRIVGTAPEEMYLPDFSEVAAPAFEKAFAGETVEFTSRIGDRHFANVVMPFYTNGRRSPDERTPADEIVGFASEVTGRRRAEEALRRSEARLSEAQRIARLGSWEWDLKTGEISWSDETYRIYGFEPGAFVPTLEKLMEIVHPDDRATLEEAIRSALQGNEPYDFGYRIVRPDGEVRFVHRRAEVAFGEGGEPLRMVGTVHDTTEHKVLEERLEHQALHDPLTDLPNRTLFADRLEHSLARATRRGSTAAVLFMDLDNFKYVNDSLGHGAGDDLLKGVAGRLRTCLRPGDTAARLGGDEFAVLLEDVGDVVEAESAARRVAEELRAPFALGGQEVFVSASVGITLGRPGHRSPEELLREADVAMYRAKEEGKARHRVFDPGMEARVVERLKLENDLRRAIERDEFEVHYQPVVHLRTGQTIGVEALVRWEHPERGLVPPGGFVPLAEETGLIVPIGRRVLREACRQAQAWHERHPSDPPSIIGVNLSARQLSHPELVGEVEEALRESGLAPERLTLEITESALVGDEAHYAGTLRDLRALGVRFALDDFGTGYSSLSYLRRLPVGLLKIDGSFVKRLGQDPEDEVLLSGVVGIASGLGLYVLAEGVETPEQLKRVKALGCDLAQGYHFSRPLPGHEAVRFLGSAPLPNDGPEG